MTATKAKNPPSIELMREGARLARAHMDRIVAGDDAAIGKFYKLLVGGEYGRGVALTVLMFAGLVDKVDRADGSADLLYTDLSHPAIKMWQSVEP